MGESAIWSSTTTAMTIGRSIVIFGGITPAIDRSMPLNDSFAVLYIRHAECFERSMNEYFFPLRTKSLTIPISSQISPFILSYPPVSSYALFFIIMNCPMANDAAGMGNLWMNHCGTKTVVSIIADMQIFPKYEWQSSFGKPEIISSECAFITEYANDMQSLLCTVSASVANMYSPLACGMSWRRALIFPFTWYCLPGSVLNTWILLSLFLYFSSISPVLSVLWSFITRISIFP